MRALAAMSLGYDRDAYAANYDESETFAAQNTVSKKDDDKHCRNRDQDIINMAISPRHCGRDPGGVDINKNVHDKDFKLMM